MQSNLRQLTKCFIATTEYLQEMLVKLEKDSEIYYFQLSKIFKQHSIFSTKVKGKNGFEENYAKDQG